MLAKLLLLFTVIPAVELALLITIGQQVGVLPTLALILTTGLGGAWLARREGTRTWHELRGSLAAGQMPGDKLLDGLAIFGGAALLLTPGLLTDIAGLLLLLPRSRGAVIRFARSRLEDRLLRDGNRIEVRSWTRDPPVS